MIPSPTMILVILLGLSTAGNVLLLNRWMSAKMDYASVKQAYKSFSDTVDVVGKAQNKKAADIKAADIKAKEKADADHKLKMDDALRTIDGLRKRTDESSSRWRLPSAPSGTSRPDLICFGRADFEREERSNLEYLSTETRKLSDEGTKSTIDLNTAKRWAQNPEPP